MVILTATKKIRGDNKRKKKIPCKKPNYRDFLWVLDYFIREVIHYLSPRNYDIESLGNDNYKFTCKLENIYFSFGNPDVITKLNSHVIRRAIYETLPQELNTEYKLCSEDYAKFLYDKWIKNNYIDEIQSDTLSFNDIVFKYGFYDIGLTRCISDTPKEPGKEKTGSYLEVSFYYNWKDLEKAWKPKCNCHE